MTDRQTPAYIAQSKRIAQLSWDQCMEQYANPKLSNPATIKMLEDRLNQHQAAFTASRLGNAWNNRGLN